MKHTTVPSLPDDHGSTLICHAHVAELMRETDEWVHISDHSTRRAAQRVASMVRNSDRPAYTGHVYDVRAITTADGIHQTWGRWIGPRGARPTRTA